MTLADVIHGPVWILPLLGILLLIISVLLLCGKGSFLIAGYNTASQKEKSRYDEKKLCRVTGLLLLFVSVIVISIFFLQTILPAWTEWIFLGLIILAAVTSIGLSNTICLKK